MYDKRHIDRLLRNAGYHVAELEKGLTTPAASRQMIEQLVDAVIFLHEKLKEHADAQ
jgi:hypothetical protein